MDNVKAGWRNYVPLMVIIGLIILICFALQIAAGSFNAHIWMQHFMGFFFVIFAMFKLINLPGFCKGFLMYDLLAKRFSAYGYIYPFIELALGLAYLSNVLPMLTNLVTLIVMAVSSLGVIKSIRDGMNIKCACLGTVLNVPLSTVSVIENVGMGLMAAGMLLKVL